MKKILLGIIVVLIFSIGSVLPLFKDGFFEYHDNTTVVRVYEMSKSLSSGMFPVRWVEGLGYGYGYPIFNFYGPLPYYIGAIFHLIGFEVVFATKLMLILGMLASGVSMFILARKFFGFYSGVVAGVFYSYFPYHAVNLYVRGAVGELFAYAALPLILYGLYSAATQKTIKKVSIPLFPSLVSSLGIFLVSTSHNLTAFMMCIMIFVTAIPIYFISKVKKVFLLTLLLAFILGITLSAFYILPAFLEMGYTNVSSQVGGGADFSDHFVCVQQLWESGWGFGGSTSGCLDGLSFRLGKISFVILILAISAFLYRLYSRKVEVEDYLVISGFVIFLASIFFMLPVSNFIWEWLIFMEYIQYPWRFLNFAGLGLSILAGYLIFAVSRQFGGKTSVTASLAVVFAVMFVNQKLFVPQAVTNFPGEYYTNKSYINYTVSRISDEYMPKSFSKPESVSDLPISRATIASGNGIVNEGESDSNNLNLSFVAQSDLLLHLNIAYFPAWKAYINGEESTLLIDTKGMRLDVPKGAGNIKIQFIQTPIEKASNTLSLLAFLSVVIVIMLKIFYGKKAS